MEQIILVLHLLIAIALVGVVLLQRSEGGGLGIGGGGGGAGPMMSVRGTANLLTRATAILAVCFVATSLTLAILAGAPADESFITDPDAGDSGTLTLPPLEQPADPLATD